MGVSSHKGSIQVIQAFTYHVTVLCTYWLEASLCSSLKTISKMRNVEFQHLFFIIICYCNDRGTCKNAQLRYIAQINTMIIYQDLLINCLQLLYKKLLNREIPLITGVKQTYLIGQDFLNVALFFFQIEIERICVCA